ncbi:MAG TPA: hypothetical protein VL087_06610 [Nitrospirota bacterium]|nr:hypothetical protein [Nitrospirota bacterium]
MKNVRRLVRERDASVFKPKRPENLPAKRSNEHKANNRKPMPQQGEQPRHQQPPKNNSAERRVR